MTDTPDLVGLLYRADWTRLSLAAEVNTTIDRDLAALREDADTDGAPARPWAEPDNPWEVATDTQGTETTRSQLLVAPGRRYRLRGDGSIKGSDGKRGWLELEQDGGWVVELTGDPEAPAEPLLRPAWLLAGYAFDGGEPVTWGGRAALRVVATPRPGLGAPTGRTQPPLDRGGPRRPPLDRVEVVVDAELGILLRHEEIFEGKTLSRTELAELTLNPEQAADDAQFHPPSGWDSARSGPATAPPGSRPDMAVLADLFGSGAGEALARNWPINPFGRPAREEDPQAQMPPDEADLTSLASEVPVSDDILHLLYGSADRWAPGISATVHQWYDYGAMLVPELGGLPAMLAPLLDAAGDRIPVIHSVSRLRAGSAGQYRIESMFNPVRHGFKEAICDGQRLWYIFDDKVTEGPARPPLGQLGAFFDTSWLLEYRLTGGAETMADGRRGYLIGVARDSRPGQRRFAPDLVVVDAELGVVLRWISRRGSRTTARYELRNVTARTADPGAFRPDLPPGLPVVQRDGDSDDAPLFPDPAKLASSIAEQAAKSARSAVQGLMDMFRGPDQR